MAALATPAFCVQVPEVAQPENSTPQNSSGLDLFAGRLTLNQPLTLQQAVEIALQNSPLMKGATAARNAAAAQVGVARAETRPTLSANTFVSGGSLPNIVESPSLPVARMIMGLPAGGYADQNLMLMYPVFTSGRIAAMVRQAEALRDATEVEREVKRREIALLTRIAYRETQARQAQVVATQARLRENKERLRLDRERLTAGRIPAYYVQQDEAQVARAEQDETNAKRDALLSLAQLKTVMGVALASRLELTDTKTRPFAEVLSETLGHPSALGKEPDAVLAALLRRAEQQRPELAVVRLRVESARRGETTARALFGPQVNLFAMGDVAKATAGRPISGTTFGITASVPLWEGGARRARSDEARATRQAQQAEQERIGLQIAQEVYEAYLRAAAAEQNVATAQAATTAATEAGKAAETRYQAGRSVLTEVLEAVALRVRAESDLAQALLEQSVANDRLQWAVGVLLPTATESDKK